MFSPEMIAVLVVINLIVAVVLVLLVRKILFRKKIKKIAADWPEVVKLVKDKDTWGQAIVAADDMLEIAVQKHGAKTKSFGENLVTLQARFSDNESLWFAHKLATKIRKNELQKVRPEYTKRAIVAFKKALKDLGELQ